MRLLFVIDDYLPDSTRVGAKMAHDLAKGLIAAGHDVIVLMPSATVDIVLQKEAFDGVPVWRFRNGAIKDVHHAKRLFNEFSLSRSAWRAIKNEPGLNAIDGIIYYSPSIFWGKLVAQLKRRLNKPAYLILRDMFPQWVIDAGMIKEHSMLARFLRYFERKCYKPADAIGLMSPRNLELFEQDNTYPNMHVLQNWTSVLKGDVLQASGLREELGLQDKVIYFYGGNIGHAQDMANLMRLAKGMQQHDAAHFLFVGQGDEVELINQLAKEWQLTNYTYLPSVSQERFQEILAQIDVGLFSLHRDHSAHNFPGKLLGYMANSLPILGSVNADNDLTDIVNDAGAGMVYVNGEDHKLLAAAEALLESVEKRESFGQNAHELMHQQFSTESAVSTIVEYLNNAS